MAPRPLFPDRSPWRSLMLLFGLVMLGAFGGQLLAAKLTGAGAKKLLITATGSSGRRQLLSLQAATASGAFIAAPLLYLYFFAGQDLSSLFQWRHSYAAPLLLALSLTVAFMGVNTAFIQWNMALKLPPWIRAFEAWAQEQEGARQQLTTLLTTFPSLKELGVGLLVIGVIPSVGEELLFRGLVQPLCHHITHNIHAAIIVSALAFSAIHLQFYGFVPRFLLGALFGYLYWWTQDLVFPIAAHLLNNTLTLLLLFLYQHRIITQDITQPTALPPSLLLFSALLAVVLAHYLKQLSKQHTP